MTTKQEMITEASTLGLAPGDWPTTIEYEGVILRRGPYNRVNGELCSVTYWNEYVELEVLND